MSSTMLLNKEQNGVELYFDGKPEQETRENMKLNGFRWNGKKLCWYAKQNQKTLAVAEQITGSNISTITASKTVKENKNNISLWDRLQFTEGTADTTKYKYKFVGSNYTGLTVKETAAEVRKHLRNKFPEVKFSVTSDYNHVYIYIISSPYNNKKLEYSPEIEPKQYREYEAEHNKELNAIQDYCKKLLNSYNWDDSDSMTDYFNCHFYKHVSIDYDYIQTEQTEAIKADITDFRNKLIEAEQAEEERKEQEYQEYLKQQEIEKAENEKRRQEEARQTEIIYNNINIKDIEESNQYFVIGSQFAKLNKNCTLDEYKEEVQKGEYNSENVKVTKEIYFNDADALDYFSNLLLHDFDFLAQTGGHFTQDNRINSMTDYSNMDSEERKTVEWILYGVAVYYNNQLQFIVNAEGYSYARYVGLVDSVTIQKEYNSMQVLTGEKLEELKQTATQIEDISTDTITENNLIGKWNGESWTQYKDLIKEQLKQHNIKLSKAIIQQLPEESEELKVAMYKLLIEVDGIKEQFKNANLQQGQKLTLFYISDFGGIVTSRIIFDSIEFTKYAQYDNAVKIIFKQPNKRGLFYKYHYRDMLVYDGWLELPESVLYDIVPSQYAICKKTKYSSCDKKQYDEVIQHFIEQGLKPIINTYKPIF